MESSGTLKSQIHKMILELDADFEALLSSPEMDPDDNAEGIIAIMGVRDAILEYYISRIDSDHFWKNFTARDAPSLAKGIHSKLNLAMIAVVSV